MLNTNIIHTETKILPQPLCGSVFRLSAQADHSSCRASFPIAEWNFSELLDLAKVSGTGKAAFSAAFQQPESLAIHPGGWQSWSAGWELVGLEQLPKKVALLPELAKMTKRDKEDPPKGKPWISGHFIIYLRIDEFFLCIASKEGDGLAPVTFYINRKLRQIRAEVFAPTKVWRQGETLAELNIFFAPGFFTFKDALKALYQQEKAFRTLDFLSLHEGSTEPEQCKHTGKQNLPGGYESWYNHYTNINEGLILEDLDALSKTDNLLKLRYLDRKRPLVFQIDDGWQRCVGDWEINEERFPRGLSYIAKRIEESAFIPGLWLAPFLVTRRSKVFSEHPEWLLCETHEGKPIVAGFNPLWDKRYYCLDISRNDVQAYLRSLIDRAIDEWGFRYLKLDFLYTGLFAGAFAEQGAPHEHYQKMCTLLTERTATAANLPVAYLGCGLPLGLSYRSFPLSRTGTDTREEWDWNAPRLLGHVGRPSAWINLRDTIGRTHLDGTVYISDPDVIFLRSKNCTLSECEKELIALLNFLLAGQIMFSDDPLNLDDRDLALTRRINSLYETLENDEYGTVRLAQDVFRLQSRSGNICGLINISGRKFKLRQGADVKLFQALSTDKLLVDHRLKWTADSLTFAPHSITLRQM